jgi:hypothetical protein
MSNNTKGIKKKEWSEEGREEWRGEGEWRNGKKE